MQPGCQLGYRQSQGLTEGGESAPVSYLHAAGLRATVPQWLFHREVSQGPLLVHSFEVLIFYIVY